MSNLSKRSTVYFDPAIHQALRVKATSTQLSVSDLVNEAVRVQITEDQEDLQAFSERVNGPEISYETLLNLIFWQSIHGLKAALNYQAKNNIESELDSIA